MIDERQFRDTMGKFATGITVVTTEYEGETMGMTVNAFMSVSLDPKLIAVSIGDQARMYTKLQETKEFGVSILSEDQRDYSMIFAKQKASDQAIPFTKLDGIPVIKGSLATIACKVKDTVKAGDHLIYIAEVTDLEVNEGQPILYYGGEYRQLRSK
ncbi:MAG TPA: flavin reductase family protein [Bacillota bacterium]|nr:flavin reductase family protein [Bacillota bacterium]